MTGIVFATEHEARPFIKAYERGRFDELKEGDILQDDKLVVTITGVGKIKAALRTERFLRSHKVDRIIHPGTCTSLNEDFKTGTLAVVSQVFEGDRIELSKPTYPRMPLANPFEDIQAGTLVTQDHIPADATEQSYWQRIAEMSDMSGYAVAYVAATYGVQCNIVKVPTGYLFAEDKNLHETLNKAYETLADFVIKAVEA